MTGFALYRLPHEQQVTLVAQTEGEPQELLSCEALNGQTGFVVAPFSVCSQTPVVLIRPDQVKTYPSAEACSLDIEKSDAFGLPVRRLRTLSPTPSDLSRTTYLADFNRFFEKLKNGDYQKLVLSRCAEEPVDEQTSPLELFLRACQLYPRLFISLVYTPKSGLWLTATPEILLEGIGNQWRTIALAGTIKLEGDELKGEGEHVKWSTKNIQEQRYVSTYLMSCLEQLAKDVREEGPRTVRAANLVHLRSDFTFSLSDNAHVGDVLQMLHPTPAVCGLPKQAAYRFIQENEHTPRLYYSGFMGPLNLQLPTSKLQSQTHLFVSLRCMQITENQYRLYAGGGLLKDSVEEMEWQETEAKLETMRQCIATKKM